MNTYTERPTVTVLMPVYNGEVFIKEAMDSVLCQTFTNFEFLIIDDGSTDRSAEIIKSYTDHRIKYISNGSNKGVPYSLNLGLRSALGKYVARMDSDDICLPRRIEKQVAYMDNHLEVTMCGSWVKTFGKSRKELVHKYFTLYEDIKASLLFNTSFCHPSVIIRKSSLEKFNLRYDVDYHYFEEDYNLWVELSKKTELTNIPEVLLLYRMHNKSVTHLNTDNRKDGVSLIKKRQLERIGFDPSEEDMRIHNSSSPRQGESVSQFIDTEEKWLTSIIEANMQKKLYAEDSLDKIIYSRWYLICRSNVSGGFSVWKKFIISKLFRIKRKNQLLDCLKILLRCL